MCAAVILPGHEPTAPFVTLSSRRSERVLATSLHVALDMAPATPICSRHSGRCRRTTAGTSPGVSDIRHAMRQISSISLGCEEHMGHRNIVFVATYASLQHICHCNIWVIATYSSLQDIRHCNICVIATYSSLQHIRHCNISAGTSPVVVDTRGA